MSADIRILDDATIRLMCNVSRNRLITAQTLEDVQAAGKQREMYEREFKRRGLRR
jgi:hypothetical protein